MSKELTKVQIVQHALEILHAGVCRGSAARNQFIENIQPVVKSCVHNALAPYRRTPAAHAIGDIISEVNCLLLERTFDQVRSMRGTRDLVPKSKTAHNSKHPGFVYRDAPGHRSPQMVTALLVRTVYGLARNLVKRRIRELQELGYERDVTTHLREVLEDRYPTDLEDKVDHSLIRKVVIRTAVTHLRFRRRPDKALKILVFKMATILVRDQYRSTGRLDVKTLDVGKGLSQNDALVLLLSDWMDLDSSLLELYYVIGEQAFLRVLEVFSGRTLKLPSVKNVRRAHESIEVYRKVEDKRKKGISKSGAMKEVSLTHHLARDVAEKWHDTVTDMLTFLDEALADLKKTGGSDA